MVFDRSITETTKDTATAVVLLHGDDPEVGGAEIVNVPIDMIRHHAIRDAAEPGICHQLVETVSPPLIMDIGVGLSLTATATGMETFAVGVFLPEIDTTIA